MELLEGEQHWQTLWTLAGPKLPKNEIFLMECVHIGPISNEISERFNQERAPVISLSGTTDMVVTHYPPRDEVKSTYKLQIDVAAKDADQADERAQAIADRLLTSLSLVVSGGRYHAELRKLRIAEAKEEFSNYSETATVSLLGDPDNLSQQEIDLGISLYILIGEDSVAENAYVHLITAWQLQSTAGAKPLERSTLQHYFLSIESIVNAVVGVLKKEAADNIRLKEREFARKFAEELPRRADKPSAIREASTKLREISLANFLPSVDLVAPALQLSASDTDAAKELYKFRSKRLSHPGRSDKAEFRKWLFGGANVGDLCLADRIARAFLRGYCGNIARRESGD